MSIKIVKPNASWIITDSKDKTKIGSIVKKLDNSYSVKLRGENMMYTSEQLIKNFGQHIFKDKTKKNILSAQLINSVYGYQTHTKPFNQVYHMQCKVPIFTKENKSKSFYCAGYYIIRINKDWLHQFCPKLITLLKYKFHGPFKTEQKAMAFARKFVT